MKKIFTSCALLIAALAVSACGGSDSKKDAAPAPAAAPTPAPSKGGGASGKNPDANASRLAPGKYYFSAGAYEAFDTSGAKVDEQTLQVTGEYTWTIEALGGESYRLTETGVAKISNSNQVVSEVNCKGAQNVYSFELTAANEVRGLTTLKSGCPAGASGVAARQFTLEAKGTNALQYVEVAQNDGVRTIVTFTFQK